jgi:hypothetical protein
VKRARVVVNEWSVECVVNPTINRGGGQSGLSLCIVN